jgi:hypothetical protein
MLPVRVRAVSCWAPSLSDGEGHSSNGNPRQDNGSLLYVVVAVGRTGQSRFEALARFTEVKPHITGGMLFRDVGAQH